MKKILILLTLLSLQSCFLITDNWGGEPFEPQSEYTAVFMDRTEFESSVTLQDSNSIDKEGKIYTFNGYLFINDKNKGFHIYDNSDPENPIYLKFINIPGATDMAIKSNIVYINQATDLIAVELSADMQSVVVTKRIINVFPEMISPDGFYDYTPDGKVLINWIPN
jgi:hypothetical protein